MAMRRADTSKRYLLFAETVFTNHIFGMSIRLKSCYEVAFCLPCWGWEQGMLASSPSSFATENWYDVSSSSEFGRRKIVAARFIWWASFTPIESINYRYAREWLIRIICMLASIGKFKLGRSKGSLVQDGIAGKGGFGDEAEVNVEVKRQFQ